MRQWVVVADSARARFFSRLGSEGQLQELADLTNPESRTLPRDLTSDKAGRSFSSAGAGSGTVRHAYEQETDPHQHQAELFAREVAERIDEARAQAQFEQLIIVAPPRFLGELRKRLSAASMDRVVQTLHQDIVRMDTTAISTHLKAPAD
jgi:protein required for attachment to host cells